MRTRELLLALALGLAGCYGSTPLDVPADGGPPPDGNATASRDAGAIPADAGARPVDPGPGGEDAGPAVCGPDVRAARLVYYGTPEPTAMPLSPGQILAMVDFDGCSGAFINDEWVLTASHCSVRVGRRLCVGPDPRNADVCFTADRVEDHPSVDLSLVHVDAPASSRIPELVPIAIMTERVERTWLGRTAEAAGYGTQEDGRSGEREFTAQPIVELNDTYVVIDGMGTRGVCFGDSGGPVMVLASDATVRVLGALSYGDPSCVGRDNYTRTDLQLAWIEGITGPTLVPGAGCGRVTPVGDCMGASTAIWCDTETGLLTSETCPSGTACGWDTAVGGYRCVSDDPCMGVSAAGACRGETAVWCDSGTLRRQECGECASRCRFVSEVGGFYCQPDPCIGIPAEGRCDGDVLTLCDPDSGVFVANCRDYGRVCGWSTRRGRNSCVLG